MVFKAAFYQIGAFHSRTADDWEKIDSSPHLSPQFLLTTVPLPHWDFINFAFRDWMQLVFGQYYKKWRLLVFKILTKIHTLYINIFSRLLYKQWDLEFRSFLIYPKRVLKGGIAVYVVCAQERYFFLLILNLISLSLLTK